MAYKLYRFVVLTTANKRVGHIKNRIISTPRRNRRAVFYFVECLL